MMCDRAACGNGSTGCHDRELRRGALAPTTSVGLSEPAVGEGVHCLKDPTRGGLATTLNEIALGSEVAIALDERLIPVTAGVRGVCEILGLDPLTIANEGKLIAIVTPEAVRPALEAMRAHPLGHQAALIGEVRAEPASMVFLRTELGGTRVLDMLVGDPLPRIC